jgi:hypothetical protein
MNFDASPTPLQSASGTVLLYCDFPQRMSETPLGVNAQSGAGEYGLFVHPDVIRTYQRVIFELQIQVQRYQLMVERLTKLSEPAEEGIIAPSQQLNRASKHVIGSIISARIPEQSVLRAFEEEES